MIQSISLTFISSKETNSEWRYLGLTDPENPYIYLDQSQKKIVGSVRRKIIRGRNYVVSRFKNLREIPNSR